MTRLDELRAKAAAKREAAEAARRELVEALAAVDAALAEMKVTVDVDDIVPLDDLAHVLSRLRGAAGLNQRELAERMGVAQTSVSKIQSGDTQPPLSTIEAWAHACGRDVFLVFPKREGA